VDLHLSGWWNSWSEWVKFTVVCWCTSPKASTCTLWRQPTYLCYKIRNDLQSRKYIMYTWSTETQSDVQPGPPTVTPFPTCLLVISIAFTVKTNRGEGDVLRWKQVWKWHLKAKWPSTAVSTFVHSIIAFKKESCNYIIQILSSSKSLMVVFINLSNY